MISNYANSLDIKRETMIFSTRLLGEAGRPRNFAQDIMVNTADHVTFFR